MATRVLDRLDAFIANVRGAICFEPPPCAVNRFRVPEENGVRPIAVVVTRGFETQCFMGRFSNPDDYGWAYTELRKLLEAAGIEKPALD
jgi:hypothetical protein